MGGRGSGEGGELFAVQPASFPGTEGRLKGQEAPCPRAQFLSHSSWDSWTFSCGSLLMAPSLCALLLCFCPHYCQCPHCGSSCSMGRQGCWFTLFLSSSLPGRSLAHVQRAGQPLSVFCTPLIVVSGSPFPF